MVWIGISRERSQIYLWLRPQKRQRKFAIEKANSSKPGALIPVLAPSTPVANSPLKGLALRLAPPPNHCAIPSSQKLQNIHRFVACSPPGSKRSSYPCPLSAHSPCPHRCPPVLVILLAHHFWLNRGFWNLLVCVSQHAKHRCSVFRDSFNR